MSDGRSADDRTLREIVRDGYAEIARGRRDGCCGPAPCCGTDDPERAAQFAAAIGYGARELEMAPDGANMGLSCGNPVALAALRPGETVLDLGCGGGFDCFVASLRVGAAGRVIGVDMTPEMIAKARRNVAQHRARSGLDNVEFRLGEIEHLPAPDACADVVISNCVLNLSPDKPQVWREMARVLRPGGRVAVSDVALLRPLPEAIRASMEALIGCIAGAVLVEETARMARDAGLENIRLEPRPAYVEAMTRGDDPLYARIAKALPPGASAADFITSLSVSATKPPD